MRPGLGYTYAVQGYDSAGGLSPSVSAVVVTPDRRPDLVCTDVDVPTVETGDAVAFRATLRNIGDGATPNDTLGGLTFFVDGKYTSYVTTDGTPLAPGESRVMTASGGGSNGKWTATAGAHVLRVLVDDNDRIPDELREHGVFPFECGADGTYCLLTPGAGKGCIPRCSSPIAAHKTGGRNRSNKGTKPASAGSGSESAKADFVLLPRL